MQNSVINTLSLLEAIHKRRSQPGGRGFFRCGHLHFLAQKTLDFLKFMVFPHIQEGGGLSQCGYFADKKAHFFVIMCRRLLWMAPYAI